MEYTLIQCVCVCVSDTKKVDSLLEAIRHGQAQQLLPAHFEYAIHYYALFFHCSKWFLFCAFLFENIVSLFYHTHIIFVVDVFFSVFQKTVFCSSVGCFKQVGLDHLCAYNKNKVSSMKPRYMKSRLVCKKINQPFDQFHHHFKKFFTASCNTLQSSIACG